MNSLYHRWSIDDDIVTLYLYRHGDASLPLKQAQIATRLGIKPGSLDMRKRNFAALDGRGSLHNTANQTREVRTHYGKLAESELRALVLQILNKNKAAA